MSEPRPPLVRFERVSLGYGGEEVIDNLSFTVDEGDLLGIVGPNGAGKSTILKALIGILRPQSGRIVYERVLHRDLRFGYVPQRHTLDSVFPLTVAEIVRMARYREAGLLRQPGEEAERVIRRAMEAVDIVNLANRRFQALSGGQRQRALIARALATGANFLVLDEPTDGMDLGSQDAILRLMVDLNARDGLTIVFVSHLLNEVASTVDRLAVIDEGRFDHGPVAEMMTASRLGAVYQVPVRVERVRGALIVLPGGRP
ncbi:MAG: metal ABC transporter ATP-binding protein [Gemmatimonadota bacterium]